MSVNVTELGKQASVSFWCRDCDEDVNLLATKYPWIWNGAAEWYWAAKCPLCRRKLVRYCAEMSPKDPYYKISRKRQEESDKMKIDTLQPSDSNFKTYYPNQWRKHEQEREEAEKKERESKTEKERQLRTVLDKHRFRLDKTAQKLKKLYLGE